MLKNPNYVYGPKDVTLPSKLHIGDYLLGRIHGYGNRTAFINGSTDDVLKYSEIAQQAMNAAVSFVHLGLKKGQTVAICSENRHEYFGAVVGILCAGGVVTAINPGYVEGEIRHAIKISKPKYVICSPHTYKTHRKSFRSENCIEKIILFGNEKKDRTLMFKDLTIPVNNGNNGHKVFVNCLTRHIRHEEFESVDVKGQIDTAFILYSSGTTGLPKGVMLTHLNVLTVCNVSNPEEEQPTGLSITPWFHTMGLMGSLIDLSAGKTVVFLPKFEVDLYLKTIEKFKIAHLTVVPPIIVATSKSQTNYDLSSVSQMYSGGAPLHKEIADLVKTKFQNVQGVFQGYGMTETTLAITKSGSDQKGCAKIGSVGTAVSDVILKIVDTENRQPLGPNKPGEICAKGARVMKGYVGKNRSEDFDEEDFFKTGDIGYYDEDGYFYIVDRLKELIKYNAFQVAPAELEGVLLSHDAVRDVGVVGIPDNKTGEVPMAFIVKQPDKEVTEKELQEFVAEKLSNPKHLRGGVRFVDAIPKNPSGKILRKELRKMAKKIRSKL